MGGKVFLHPGSHGEPELNVPRMRPEVYKMQRSKCAAILKGFYETVVTPAEAPGKVDHGDVDFLVSSPLATITDGEHWTILAKAFDAARTEHRSSGTASFAVRIDDDDDNNNNDNDTAAASDKPATYAQIDVHVCAPDRIAWTAFHQSYGDLWLIVGLMIRGCGLTANDKGLFVRVEAIEAEADSKSASFLFLTNDPAETLDFLGLDQRAYARGFESENELYGWVGGSRLFSRQAFVERQEKSSDRQHLRKRAMHRGFVTEWIKSAEAQAKDKGSVSREAVFEDALVHFGVGLEYDRTMSKFRAQQREKVFWSRVASKIPLEGSQLGLAIRALKRWVRFDGETADTAPRIVISDPARLDSAKQPLWTADSGRTEPELLAWVGEHWAEIKAKERQREKDVHANQDEGQGGGGDDE